MDVDYGDIFWSVQVFSSLTAGKNSSHFAAAAAAAAAANCRAIKQLETNTLVSVFLERRHNLEDLPKLLLRSHCVRDESLDNWANNVPVILDSHIFQTRLRRRTDTIFLTVTTGVWEDFFHGTKWVFSREGTDRL